MIVGHPNSGKIGYEMSLQYLEDHFTMVYYEPRGTGKSEAPQTIEAYVADSLVQEIEDAAGLILSGTSLVGTQQESADRRKAMEQQRAQGSEWFAQMLKDWDHMEQHKTTTDPGGRALSAASIKWWCYDEASFQKILPMVQAIAQAGRRKPVNGRYYYETPNERQKYLDQQQQFSNIRTKILIINGEFDTNNTPQYAAAIHEALPGSKLVLIDKAGHFPWIENADETFREIDHWIGGVGE